MEKQVQSRGRERDDAEHVDVTAELRLWGVNIL